MIAARQTRWRGEQREDRPSHKSLVFSVLIHGGLGVFLLTATTRLPQIREDSITVEIMPAMPTPTRKASVPKPANKSPAPLSQVLSPKAEKPPAVPAPAPQQNTNAPVFEKPQRMLSAAVLADPRSRDSLETLKQLRPADQVEQLCNLEAMEQVGAWSKQLKPDRVVAYAMKNPRLSGTNFVADGAAVHSKHDWYQLRFKCSLAATKDKVLAFEFLLGEAIPRDLWPEYNLPDEDTSLD